MAGGKVKRITALRPPLAWRSNSTGGQVVGIQSRIAGALTRSVGVSFSSSLQSHSSGSIFAASAMLPPHSSARRRRSVPTVSFRRNGVVSRICGASSSSLVRQRKPSTTAMVALTGREGTQGTPPESTPSQEEGRLEPRLKGKGSGKDSLEMYPLRELIREPFHFPLPSTKTFQGPSREGPFIKRDLKRTRSKGLEKRPKSTPKT